MTWNAAGEGVSVRIRLNTVSCVTGQVTCHCGPGVLASSLCPISSLLAPKDMSRDSFWKSPLFSPTLVLCNVIGSHKWSGTRDVR